MNFGEGNDIYGNSGSNSGGGGGGGTPSNRIESNDLTSSVTAQNGGVIEAQGTFNFLNNSLIGVDNITGSPGVPLDFNKINAQIRLDDDSLLVTTNSIGRIQTDSSVSALVAPDGTTGYTAVNDAIAIGTTTGGVAFNAIPGVTALSVTGQNLILNSTSLQSSAKVIIPSNQNVLAPDISFADSSITGIYSSAIGTVSIAASGSAITNFDTAGVNLLDHSLNRVTQINGSVGVPLDLNKVNSQLRLDNDSLLVTTNSNTRLSIDNTISSLLAPDSLTGISMVNNDVVLRTATGSLAVQAIPGTTNINATSLVNINGGGANSASFDSVGITTQHALIYNQNPVVGSYNPLMISANGLTIMYIENRALPDASAPYGVIGVASNNFLFGRANRSGGAPTTLNPGGLGVGINGMVGINTTIPTSQLHITGTAGLTLRIVDTQQAAGRIIRCLDALGNIKWEDANVIVNDQSNGSLYFEDAINSGVELTAMVALNTKYKVDVVTTLGITSGFTMPSNARLTYTGATTRNFRVLMNVSFSNNLGELEIKDIYFWLYKNGAIVIGSSVRSASILEDWTDASIEFLVSLSTNDYIELYASNESPAIISTASIRIGTLHFIIS